MNKKVLLVGCGSEIGSMLISMNNLFKDGFLIDTVLTNKIDEKEKNTFRNSLESVYARIVLSNPSLLEKVSLNIKKNIVKINNRKIKFFWGDVSKFDITKIKKKFAVTIIATSKKHISNKIIMKKFLKVSEYVVGVAESKNFPSMYPNLLNLNSKLIDIKPKNIGKEKIFALGSCQSNGWQAQLRGLIEVFENLKVDYFKMLGTEVDIIHPDTPQGRLGTKSIEPREQDARNNFRPSFSQVGISMKKLFPKIHSVHTVSLRTLISPPGYQISRFYFRYKFKNNTRINKEIFLRKLKAFSKKNPEILKISDNTLGSKAFEFTETSAIMLSDEKYFHLNENLFSNNLKEEKNSICQIIMQSYVHNTRGYCRSVLNCIKKLLENKKKIFIF